MPRPDADATRSGGAGGGAVSLREPSTADELALLRWRGDAANEPLMLWHGTARGPSDVKAWVARRTGDPAGRFWIVTDRTGEAVGFAQLTAINVRDGHAACGLFVDESVRGRGVSAAALNILVEASRELGLRKLVIEVLATNARAIDFWTRSGFARVGVLREHYACAGQRHDVVMMERLLAEPTETAT